MAANDRPADIQWLINNQTDEISGYMAKGREMPPPAQWNPTFTGLVHPVSGVDVAVGGDSAVEGSVLVFTRDHLFTSPSMAAMAVMGRSANGWIEWKAANGKTLDEVKRQVVGVAG